MGTGFVIGVLVGLAVLIGLSIGTGWFAVNNQKVSAQGVMIPFSATINPDGTMGSFTATDPNTGATVNQITCPLGTTINTVGGFSQVTDPYGMCLGGATQSPPPSLAGSTLAVTCGMTGSVVPAPVASQVACSSDSDCNGGAQSGTMACVSGRCQLNEFDCKGKYNDWCKTNAACQDLSGGQGAYQCIDTTTGGPCDHRTKQGMCIESNICFSATYPGNPAAMYPQQMNPNGNAMCAPGGPGLCAVRDISAYVASQCDGQQTCNPALNSLGPLPCSLSPVNCNFNLSSPQDYSSERLDPANGFCALPFAYGNGSSVSVPGIGGLPNSATPTASLGYTVHGIYTCI